jgi:hypothetical protein
MGWIIQSGSPVFFWGVACGPGFPLIRLQALGAGPVSLQSLTRGYVCYRRHACTSKWIWRNDILMYLHFINQSQCQENSVINYNPNQEETTGLKRIKIYSQH